MQEDFFKISGVVQHYAWGGFDFIPSLLKRKNPEHRPFAEYWLGAHPSHPSVLEDGTDLADYIRKNNLFQKENNSGEAGELPFLLKVLDVRQMLSIQVHPGRQGAIKGYEEEERKGVAADSNDRNYRDKNHKPELMVALEDFYLLHGFKSPVEINSTLQSNEELKFLLPFFAGNNYKKLYETIMRLPQEQVNEVLKPLASRVLPLYQNGELKKEQADFWAARAILEFCTEEQFDRGIFSIYLFNLVCLKKGEGIFQDHGLPHAYLEGRNVEVMANSDNVLRAGLTKKKIDVEELLKHVSFCETNPEVLMKGNGSHIIYHTPANEFELQHFFIERQIQVQCGTGEIWWVENGSMEVKSRECWQNLVRGEALFFSRETSVDLLPGANTSVFRVLIPRG